MPDAEGFVLAGGASRRMGRDKALLELAGRPLIAHALEILRLAGLPASISGAWQDGAGVQSSLGSFAPVIADSEPALGPLAGICAALASTPARHGVFISVDAPLIPPSLIVSLLHHARVTGSLVTLASVSGFAQTFPAVVDRRALPALKAEMNAGRRGCYAAFQATGEPVSTVAAELLAQCGQAGRADGLPPWLWFLNLNTPGDLERIRALTGG